MSGKVTFTNPDWGTHTIKDSQFMAIDADALQREGKAIEALATDLEGYIKRLEALQQQLDSAWRGDLSGPVKNGVADRIARLKSAKSSMTSMATAAQSMAEAVATMQGVMARGHL